MRPDGLENAASAPSPRISMWARGVRRHHQFAATNWLAGASLIALARSKAPRWGGSLEKKTYRQIEVNEQ
jgi:hypothetical protein